MTTPNAWPGAEFEPAGCPECGRDSCEDHFATKPNGHDPDDEEQARAARHALKLGEELQRERVRREARRIIDAEERGPIVAPEILTLTDLLAEPDPPVAWRIEGWQPAESRVVLAAPRKAGKTTLVTSLVRSLVDGDSWLGQAAVQSVDGRVGILDLEMSKRQLRAWYRTARIDRDDRVVVVPLRGKAARLDLQDTTCRAAWAAWLRERDVRYLIVDCLRPALDAAGLDESREAGRFLTALDALLVEAGIPECLVIHHMGHAGLGGTERSRGDSRIRDWPDVEWKLIRQKDDDDASPRFISAYGRDVEQPEQQLAYDRLTRRLTLAGGSRTDVRAEAALDAVIEAIAGAGTPQSGRQIETLLADSDHGRDTIRAALRRGTKAPRRRLLVEDGPRRSRLYRTPSMPAAGEIAAADAEATP